MTFPNDEVGVRGTRNRRGMAIHLILSLLLSMTIITLTYVIGTSKTKTPPSLLTDIKADYQLESAVILNFIHLQGELSRGQTAVSAWEPQREITPGVSLRSGYKKTGQNLFRFMAYLSSQGFERRLFAQAVWREPAILPPPQPPVVATIPLAPTQNPASSEILLPATATELLATATVSPDAENPVAATTTATPTVAPVSGAWVLEYLPDQGNSDQ